MPLGDVDIWVIFSPFHWHISWWQKHTTPRLQTTEQAISWPSYSVKLIGTCVPHLILFEKADLIKQITPREALNNEPWRPALVARMSPEAGAVLTPPQVREGTAPGHRLLADSLCCKLLSGWFPLLSKNHTFFIKAVEVESHFIAVPGYFLHFLSPTLNKGRRQ